MSGSRIRIGISGSGFGVRSHLPALLAHPRYDVVALASPSRAGEIARERGIQHAFAACAEMVEGCALDAVTVASPPHAHQGDVLAALAAGKAVLCEKPFARTLDEAHTMLRAAERAGTACGVAHEFRFVPQTHALYELVANHHLDPLRQIEITYLHAWLGREGTRGRGWWFERARGGGLAGAMLSHCIDEANWLAGGSPDRVTGFTRTANPRRRDAAGDFESDVDDGAFALLHYPGGAVARLTVDATVGVASFTSAVHGEKRTAVASGPGIMDLRLFSVDAEETNELECKPSPYAKFASIDPHVPFLMELYDEFARAIDGEPNALPTFAQALATQEVLTSIGYGHAPGGAT